MKKMIKYVAAIAAAMMLLTILGSVSYAQNDPFNFDYEISPSVETFQMERSGKISHSLHTGAMSYSLPVYSYSDPDFNFPISIDYYFDGLKPSMQSGSIGLGWYLSMGGAVTRDIRGMADDCYDMDGAKYGFFHTVADGISPDTALVFSNASSFTYQYRPSSGSSFNLDVMSDLPAYIEDSESLDSHYDTEPDIFHVVAPGLSADFVMGFDGEFHVVSSSSPYGELTVEYTYSNSPVNYEIHTSEFTVTAGNGYKYVFGGSMSACEYSFSSLCNVYNEIIRSNREGSYNLSAWKLKQIIAPNGRTLSIEYRPYHQAGLMVTKSFSPAYSSSSVPGQGNPSPTTFYGHVGSHLSWNSSLCFSVLPDRILVGNDEIVKFDYSPKIFGENDSRSLELFNISNFVNDFIPFGMDNEQELALDRITVRNRESRTISRMDLSHAYTEASSGPKKMFLESVTLFDGSSYGFEYSGGMNAAYPCINTDNTDHWGYWNGNGGCFDIRSFIRDSSPLEWTMTNQLTTTRKDANYQYALVGALTSIAYPTGGTTSIQYAPHSAQYIVLRTGDLFPHVEDNSSNAIPGGIRVSRIDDVSDDYAQTRIFRYSQGIITRFPRYAITLSYMYHANGRSEDGEQGCDMVVAVTGYSNEVCMGLMKDSHITYGTVEEEYQAGGSIVRQYSDWRTNPDLFLSGEMEDKRFSRDFTIQGVHYTQPAYCASFGLPPYCDMSAMRGKVIREAIYNVDYIETEDIYTYTPALTYSVPVVTNAMISTSKIDRDFVCPLLTETVHKDYDTNRSMGVSCTGVRTSYGYNDWGETTNVTSWSLDNPLDRRVTTTQYCHSVSGAYYPEECRGCVNDVEQNRQINGVDYVLSSTRYYYTGNNPSPSYIIRTRNGKPENIGITYNYLYRPTRVSRSGGRYVAYEWNPAGINVMSKTVNGPENKSDFTWIDMIGLSGIHEPSGQERLFGYDEFCRPFSVKRQNDEWLSATYYEIGNDSNIRYRTYIDDDDGHYDDRVWYNGLGMMNHKSEIAASPDGTKDIVTHIGFDDYGRPDTEVYLDYAIGLNGMKDTLSAVHQKSYYENLFPGEGDYAYEADFRKSESLSDRVTSIRKPGYAFRSKYTRFTYRMNHHVSDTVLVFSMIPNTDVTMDMQIRLEEDPWPDNTLHCAVEVDEDGKTTRLYSDAWGRLICEKRGNASTYYIYDLRDNLSCVIQPEGVSWIPLDENIVVSGEDMDDVAQRYCFSWKYDSDGVILESHVPGAGYNKNVYDARNRLVLSSDSMLREEGLARYYVYDIYDRIEEEGLCQMDRYDEYVIRQYVIEGDDWRDYVNDMTPTRCCRYYSEAYSPVEDYPEFLFELSGAVDTTRCMMTLAWERVFESPALNATYIPTNRRYIDKLYFYDYCSRPAQRIELGSDGCIDSYQTEYDYAGNVLSRLERHTNSGNTSLRADYTYDSRGRVLCCARTLRNGNSTTVLDTVEYGYDELGHLVSKSVGGKVAESYEYDIRGWTRGITATRDTCVLFSETIRFENPQMPGSTALYSGNISEIETVQYGNPKDIYAYSYDGLSRLIDARHFIGGPLGASNTNTERLMEYDLNGNLLWIQRCGATPSSFENLEFTYNGNRLTGAKDWRSGVNNTYSYDLNGNRTVDGRTGLEFTYNLLNLPCDINEIQWDMEAGMYQYWSDGTKKRGQDSDGDGHRYAGSFSYETDCGEDTGRFSVAWDEGRTYVSYSGAVSDRWFVRDHLGNVRAVVDLSAPANADVDDVIVEQNDYLPFGTKAVRPTLATSSDNLYRYAGKEEQTLDYLETGLIDFGARYYDPWSCQWTAVDPLAEKYSGMTPYGYCGTSPVMFLDPDGRYIKIVYYESDKRLSFKYSGQETNIPDNSFVSDVIRMYKYNKSNWETSGQAGECPSTELVESSDKGLYVYQGSIGESEYSKLNGGIPYIQMNTYEGLQTDNGTILSPATIFAHEADHALDDLSDNKAHMERQGKQIADYDNIEERRVITGSEQKMALANGEITSGVTRSNHYGQSVVTLSPTSNEIDKVATAYYRNHKNK